ncbi:hypothetical protein HNQ72_005067 [Rhizobium wenxiniae]|uniref:Uncharacterized protein n=1 Tax=Rhizobium wenxiniae TaxID=1737357 RepID=A0A7X0D372_9HYPH|nr:hypothetical protein [Rhizobium wenxiniae]MBB6165221.1 hypothetical protein [Rhizobium wenxiniae]
MAKVDDNIVNIREWETDPMDAEAFWQANVEALAEREKREVFLHLPSISDADIDEGRHTEQGRTQQTPDTSAGGVQRQTQSSGGDDKALKRSGEASGPARGRP